MAESENQQRHKETTDIVMEEVEQEEEEEVKFRDADAKENRHFNNMPSELELDEFDVVEGTSIPFSPVVKDS